MCRAQHTELAAVPVAWTPVFFKVQQWGEGIQICICKFLSCSGLCELGHPFTGSFLSVGWRYDPMSH